MKNMIILHNVIINFRYLLIEKYENDKCLKSMLMVENDFYIFEKIGLLKKLLKRRTNRNYQFQEIKRYPKFMFKNRILPLKLYFLTRT